MVSSESIGRKGKFALPDRGMAGMADLRSVLRAIRLSRSDGPMVERAASKAQDLDRPATIEPSPNSRWQKVEKILYDSILQLGVGMLITFATIVFTNPVVGGGIILCLAWIFFGLTIIKHVTFKRPTICNLVRGVLVVALACLFYAGWRFIPRPEPSRINLQFKDSSFATASVRRRLNQDFNGMREYLISLGISAPSDLPPIAIQEGSAGGPYFAPGLPLYRGQISIGSDYLSNDQQCTYDYVGYDFDDLFFNSSRLTKIMGTNPNPFPAVLPRIMTQKLMERQLAIYFVWSFWGKDDESRDMYPLARVLWNVNRSFGDDFGDRLAVATLQATIDNPEEGAELDPFHYAASKLKIADFIIDGGGKKWPQIVALSKDTGLPVDN